MRRCRPLLPFLARRYRLCCWCSCLLCWCRLARRRLRCRCCCLFRHLTLNLLRTNRTNHRDVRVARGGCCWVNLLYLRGGGLIAKMLHGLIGLLPKTTARFQSKYFARQRSTRTSGTFVRGRCEGRSPQRLPARKWCFIGELRVRGLIQQATFGGGRCSVEKVTTGWLNDRRVCIFRFRAGCLHVHTRCKGRGDAICW